MKKIGLFGLGLLMSFAVLAQNAVVGIKGGLNLATNTNSNPIAEPSYKLGYNAGFLVNLNISPKIAVQPELVYSNQGHKYTIESLEYLGGPEEHSLHLNYLNVPVLLQFKATPQFRLQTGPQVGFLTSVNDQVNGETTGFFTSSDFKKTDVAWSFGLSFMGNSGIGVDARYNLGLTDINNTGRSSVIKNNVAQVGLVMELR